MLYPTVLGYKNNRVVALYKQMFLEKLHDAFGNIDINEKHKKIFISLDRELQESFLFHPDISSLLCDASPDSLVKVSEELSYFLEKQPRYTPNSGDIIPGTLIKLTDIDNNPTQDNLKGWGIRDSSEWLDVFGDAFALLKRINIESYEEINDLIKKIVPIKTSVDVHNSCSYKNYIGALYLGYTIDTQDPEINILEALIHESSHNKLNLIMQSEKLHVNDFSLQYYSPYRTDARHIQGVFLGVHAIVPTVFILLQGVQKGIITNLEWKQKIILYHLKNKLGLNVLKKYLKPTLIGTKIIEDLIQVIGKCDILIQEIHLMDDIALKEIQDRARKHLLCVKYNFPKLQY